MPRTRPRADKALGAHLDDLQKAVARQRKAAQAREEDEADENTPALLTTRMLPLLRQVKKGEPLAVLVAVAGKDAAVLLSRRALSPARRKLLADYLEAGPPKFFAGQCVFEANSFTFVLPNRPAGLARKLVAALLKQLELRLKVRVRGDDPGDIEEADGNADDTAGGLPPPAAPAQAQAQTDISPVRLGKAGLAWRRERQQAIGEIRRLQAALRAVFHNASGQGASLEAAVAQLERRVEQLGSDLDDRLDALLNAATPAAREARAASVRELLGRTRDWIAADALMQEIDGNEILPDQTVAEPLLARLTEIEISLG